MVNFVLINNQIIAKDQATISPEQRGFLFGDGVFDSIKVNQGQLINWQAHFQRIKDGLQFAKINFETADLKQQAQKLIQANQIQDGFLRIYISRGIGSRGYMPTNNSKSLLYISSSKEIKMKYEEISLNITNFRKNSQDYLFENQKLAQGMKNTLIKITAKEQGFFDSIILNEKDQICETSSANIFWIKNDEIFTPDHKCGLLLGTIRQKIIDQNKVNIVRAGIEELKNADSIFMTNIKIRVLFVDKLSFCNKIFLKDKVLLQ